MSNPFTIMRENVEYLISSDQGLKALGLKLRAWNDANRNIADDIKSDSDKWIRVETAKIEDNPFWANGAYQRTQTLNIVMALPIGRGFKQEDIEEAYDRVALALIDLRQGDHGQLHKECESFSIFKLQGGDVALADSSDPNREKSSSNYRWSTVATATIEYEELVSAMQARKAS